MDHPVLSGQTQVFDNDDTLCLEDLLRQLKEVAIETNKEWAEKLGIDESKAITCVKPSGTVSQLVDSASGIHTRHSEYYIRTVRIDKKDPLYPFLKDQGVPVEDAIGKEESTAVFSFPVKAPEGALTRTGLTAVEQLELWKVYALNWCEHKPSVTVSVKEREWFEVGAWVYENFDICSGVSFLPYSDHVYRQAPYTDITEEEYLEAEAQMPEIDWSKLIEYETEDNTTSGHELACSAGSCEIV
jgi:ribonucleoside-diphosphate reductase alpha chain